MMMTRILRAFAAALALGLALAFGAPWPASADLLLLDIGGFGALGVPTSITISTQLFGLVNQSDIPAHVLTDGWTADIAFSGLGSYGATVSAAGSTPAQTCDLTNGICTDTAFSTAGGAPQWSAQAAFSAYSAPIAVPVTRPGYSAAGVVTTVSDTVTVTSFLRQPAPNPIPLVGLSNGNPLVAVVLSKAVYANDTVSNATVPANIFWDGSKNSGKGVSVPVSNSSTRAYPAVIGNWVTEPGLVFDGTGSATVEFFGGHALAYGAQPLAGVTVIMQDSVGNSATQTAVLQQSTRLPSTGCTATSGSNVLTNCGNVNWAIVGARVNVVSTQNATATASSAISTGSATFTISGATSTPVAGQAVFDASGMVAIGTVQSYSAPTVTLTANATNAGTSGDALVFSGGGVRGEPVVGAIDTTATANCSSGQLPCIELYVQQNATFNTDGSLTLSMPTAAVGGGTLPSTQAIADGAFLGGTLTEVGGGGLWSVSNHKIVAPYGVSTATQGVGSTTTLPAPVQGQWLAGMFVYDSASTPCVKTDVYSAVSSYISTYVSGAASTLAPTGAVLGVCNNHTLTGLGIAAAPGATHLATVSISTDATTATSGTDTVQINHQFFGASGSVTVTANTPAPVYTATFPASAFSGLTPGEIFFRAKAYPSVGDQILDTDSPTTLGADVVATYPWTTSSTALTIKNCSGVIFTSQLAVEVVDTTTGQNIGLASSCVGTTLRLTGPAASNGSSGDLLAIGSNIECEWNFFNGGASLGFLLTGQANGVMQSCVPNNPAWFGHGLTNAEKVSHNAHNLWAYYDKAGTGNQSYAWRYIFVNSSGTCTPTSSTASCVQTSNTDPLSNASYVSSIASAVTGAKYYNNSTSNRTAAHNDPNGVVICLMANGSPWAMAAVVGTTLKPPPVISSVAAGGTCPVPGTYGPQAATLKDGATGATMGASLRAENLITGETGTSYIFRSSASYSESGFATTWLVLHHVSNQSQSTLTGFYSIGDIWAYDILDNSGVNKSGLLAPTYGTTALIAGSTISCGGYTSGATGYANNASIQVMNLIGDDTWLCTPGPGNSIMTSSATPWPDSEIWAYNRFMGNLGIAGPFSLNNQAQNTLVTHVVFESVNNRVSNAECLEAGGDSFDAPLLNTVFQNITCLSGRYNKNFIEGFGLVPALVASGGSLAVGPYYAEVAYSRASSNPNVVSSADSYVANLTNGFAPFVGTVATAGSSYKFTPPCDFTELATFYLDQPSGMQAGGTTANLAVSSGSGTSMVLSAAPTCPTGGCGPGIPGAANPQLVLGAGGAAGSFISANGSTLLTDTGGKPIYITGCPGGGCGAAGTYTLSGTLSSSMSAGTYYAVSGQITHLADVASFSTGSTSGATLTLTSAPTGNLYVNATLATASAVIVTSGGQPVRIQSCPAGGCGVAGPYVLTGTPSSALVSGTTYNAQATGLSMCQYITVVAVDTVAAASEPNNWLPAPIPSITFPSRNYFKDPWFERADIWTDTNMKADYYQNMVNGGRVGNWPNRYGVDESDMVYVTAPYGQIGSGSPCFDYFALCGEVQPKNTWFSTATQATVYGDMSAIRYAAGDDRSFGGGDSGTTSETYPGLNIGMGDPCPTTSNILPTTTATIANGARMAGTGAAPRVPAGDAQWPFDIEGNPHFANLPGWSGACEMGAF